jgi:PRTRC genetic system protein E
MLLTNLLPLLARYSLGFDLVAGADDTVTLTIIPRKAEGSKHALESGEVRPISITGTAAEIDEELAKGTDGALGGLITARKSLADQLAEQREAAADAAKTAAAKAKPAAKAAPSPAPAKGPASPPAPAAPPADPKPGESVNLWD